MKSHGYLFTKKGHRSLKRIPLLNDAVGHMKNSKDLKITQKEYNGYQVNAVQLEYPAFVALQIEIEKVTKEFMTAIFMRIDNYHILIEIPESFQNVVCPECGEHMHAVEPEGLKDPEGFVKCTCGVIRHIDTLPTYDKNFPKGKGYVHIPKPHLSGGRNV